MEILKTEQHLSNRLSVKTIEGGEKTYSLSILNVELDVDGIIRGYSVAKFEREQAAVSYHDSSLILTEISPGVYSLSECD